MVRKRAEIPAPEFPPDSAELQAAEAKAKRLTRMRGEAAKQRDQLSVAAVAAGRSQSEVASLAG